MGYKLSTFLYMALCGMVLTASFLAYNEAVLCPKDLQPTAAAAKSFQLCPTLCDPMDDSPPGSPVPGVLQARTQEWVAISFSNLQPTNCT